VWAMVAIHDRTHAGLHLRRAGYWVGALQPAICRAALAASFANVDSRLLAASAVLGVSKLQTFWRVIVPLSTSGLVTAMALTFAHTMGEFGVVLMVGGNIPGVTRTLSINIYDQVQDLNYSAANTTALVLGAIAFMLLSLVYSFNRSLWKVWPRI